MIRTRYVGPFITNAEHEVLLQRVPEKGSLLYEIPGFPMRRGVSPETTLRAGMQEKFGLEVRPGVTIAQELRYRRLIFDVSCRLVACMIAEIPERLEDRQLAFVDLRRNDAGIRNVTYGGIAEIVKHMVQNEEIQF